MRRYSASAWEHYTVALIDVEEYCSALHLKERAKRIQLVPKHTVCLCLHYLQGMLIRVDGGAAIPSLALEHTHTSTHA